MYIYQFYDQFSKTFFTALPGSPLYAIICRTGGHAQPAFGPIGRWLPARANFYSYFIMNFYLFRFGIILVIFTIPEILIPSQCKKNQETSDVWCDDSKDDYAIYSDKHMAWGVQSGRKRPQKGRRVGHGKTG
jgi:hypothetical protein